MKYLFTFLVCILYASTVISMELATPPKSPKEPEEMLQELQAGIHVTQSFHEFPLNVLVQYKKDNPEKYASLVELFKSENEKLVKTLGDTSDVPDISLFSLYMPFGIPVFAPAEGSLAFALLRDRRASFLRVMSFNSHIFSEESKFVYHIFTPEKMLQCLNHINDIQSKLETYNCLTRKLGHPGGKQCQVQIKMEDVLMARGVLQALHSVPKFYRTSVLFICIVNLLATVPLNILQRCPLTENLDIIQYLQCDAMFYAAHNKTEPLFPFQDFVFTMMPLMKRDQEWPLEWINYFHKHFVEPYHEKYAYDPVAILQAIQSSK